MLNTNANFNGGLYLPPPLPLDRQVPTIFYWQDYFLSSRNQGGGGEFLSSGNFEGRDYFYVLNINASLFMPERRNVLIK